MEQEMIKNVRKACENLPEVEEHIDGFGHTVFRVRRKSFARVGGMEGALSLWFKADKESQEILIHQEQYNKAPYIGKHGWVSVEPPVEWSEVNGLLVEAYLHAAPKRLVQKVLDNQMHKES